MREEDEFALRNDPFEFLLKEGRPREFDGDTEKPGEMIELESDGNLLELPS